jgi:hypothetical protein
MFYHALIPVAPNEGVEKGQLSGAGKADLDYSGVLFRI